jgi:hypothetical protein
MSETEFDKLRVAALKEKYDVDPDSKLFEDFALNPYNLNKTSNFFGQVGSALLDNVSDPNA